MDLVMALNSGAQPIDDSIQDEQQRLPRPQPQRGDITRENIIQREDTTMKQAEDATALTRTIPLGTPRNHDIIHLL